MKLSIIVPVYNEEKTVALLLKKLVAATIPNVEREIIVIDDGSTDASASAISGLKLPASKIKFIQHKKNSGKGSAIKTGIQRAKGDYILIQDADLEYDPQDITKLIRPIQDAKAQVVYGTRLKRMPNLSRDEKDPRLLLHYFGNKFLSIVTSMLYFQWVTDMETCYKLFPRKAVENMSLRARGFEFEPEITAKLLKANYKIYEIPISTNPRGYGEGKKLDTVRDGAKAFWTLIKYRFAD